MSAQRFRWLPILTILLTVVCGHILAYYIVSVPSQLEIVVLVAIAFFYPVLRKPLVGLYCVFILAPFIPYVRRIYYLAYDRPTTDPLIMLDDVFLAIMLMGLFFEFRERRDKDRPIRNYVALIMFYFVFMALRTVFYTYIPLLRSIQLFKFFGVPVLYFLIAVVYANRLKHLKYLWYITVGISVIGALYGIKQLHFGYSHAEEIWFSSIGFTTLFIQGIARPFSIFQAPASLADYCQLGIIGLLMCGGWMRKSYRILLWACVPFLVYAILITSVRSSWIGMIAVIPLWMIVLKVKGTSKRIISMVVMVLFFITYQFISELAGAGLNMADTVTALAGKLGDQEIVGRLVTDRTSAISNPFEEHSFLSRLTLWRKLIESAHEPVTAFMGRGLGALKADSLYFTYFAEFGYPGVILIITVLVVFIRRGIYTIDNHPNPQVVILARGITAMNVIFALISITGTHIHSFPGDLYFWFWNGVLVKISTLDIPDDTPLPIGNYAYPGDT